MIAGCSILETLREDGFALVYRAHDPRRNQLVAVKVCVARDPLLRQRFLAAAERATVLRHPAVATVYEHGWDDERPFLVEDHPPGQTLAARLRAAEDPVSAEDAVAWLAEVAGALSYAHDQGVLHGNLKPETVRILEVGHVAVTDFGIARLAEAATGLTHRGILGEEAGYTPPEQALGWEPDARTDVYCFGALAHQVLTGSRPFDGRTVSELLDQTLRGDVPSLSMSWAGCPVRLEATLARCLRRDPGERFSSFREIAAELDEALAELTAESSTNLDDTQPVPPLSEVTAIVVPPPEAASQDLQTAYATAPESPPAGAAVARRPPVFATLAAGVATAGRDLGRKLAQGTARALSAAAGLLRRRTARRPPARPTSTTGTGGGSARRRFRPALLLTAVPLLAAAAGWLLWAGWASSRGPGSSPPQVAAPTPAAAAPLAEGLLVIDAAPWGEVQKLTDAAGRDIALPEERATPLALHLPPGSYRAVVARTGSGQPRSCSAELAADGRATCRAAFPPLDVDAYFKESGWWR